MAKQILKDYLSDIDRLKDAITEESEKLLKVMDVSSLLSLNTEQKKAELTELLMDFWEAQDKKIESAIELGEDKADLLIDAAK